MTHVLSWLSSFLRKWPLPCPTCCDGFMEYILYIQWRPFKLKLLIFVKLFLQLKYFKFVWVINPTLRKPISVTVYFVHLHSIIYLWWLFFTTFFLRHFYCLYNGLMRKRIMRACILLCRENRLKLKCFTSSPSNPAKNWHSVDFLL